MSLQCSQPWAHHPPAHCALPAEDAVARAEAESVHGRRSPPTGMLPAELPVKRPILRLNPAPVEQNSLEPPLSLCRGSASCRPARCHRPTPPAPSIQPAVQPAILAIASPAAHLPSWHLRSAREVVRHCAPWRLLPGKISSQGRLWRLPVATCAAVALGNNDFRALIGQPGDVSALQARERCFGRPVRFPP